jgi:hypothetical protein
LRVLVLALICAAGVYAEPRVVFTKSFPGSKPAFVEITVEKSGDSQYRDAPDDDNPLKFHIRPGDVAAIFDLSEKLQHFSKPLEANVKVAFMGKKTFRYEGDGDPKEASFNYSDVEDAKSLLDWFERIGETERALIELERTVRFDKLGVQDAILRIEVVRNQKRLVAEEQFLPLLDRVTKSEAYIHLARSRAAALAESIRAEAAQATP